MKPLRLALFVLIDYVVASVITVTLSFAAVRIFQSAFVAYVSLLFIPLSTLLFSALYFRGIHAEHPRRLEIAAVWIVVSFAIDLLLVTLVYHMDLGTYLANPVTLAVTGLKFMAVFVGAYIGLTKPQMIAADLLSPR